MDDMPGWGFKKILGGHQGDGASNFFQSHIGIDVDVYLIDSGITAEHSEFSFLNKTSRIETLADLVDAADQGRDRVGHGTGIASIIGGIFVGVAPEVKIYNLRISKDLHAVPEKVVEALEIALAHHKNKLNTNRPSVVNLSFVMRKNIEVDAKVKQLIEAGMIVVCAAGDQGEPVENFSPAGLDEVITVAGFDKNLNWSSGVLKATGKVLKNNFGPAVDISAPSELVNVAAINNYTPMSGTSMACAYVTGVVACMLEADPSLKTNEVKQRLIANSRSGLNFSDVHANGQAPDRILFNPLQLLKPRWDRTQSLLGVFSWGSKIDVKFNCSSRIGDNLSYELVNGVLPDGLAFNSEGCISGEIKRPDNVSDEPEYFNLLVRAKDKSGESERLLYIIAAQNDKIDNLKMSQGLVRLSSLPKYPCDRWCNTLPGGHPCCCVTGQTLIDTPHGLVPIEQIEIGNEVLGLNGEIAHVLDFIQVDLGQRKLYSINEGEAFFTSEHPFVGPEGEFAIDPKLAERMLHRPVNQMSVGIDVFVGKLGEKIKIKKITEHSAEFNLPMYNLIVNGSGNYIANGYGISGKFILGTASLPFSRNAVFSKQE